MVLMCFEWLECQTASFVCFVCLDLRVVR